MNDEEIDIKTLIIRDYAEFINTNWEPPTYNDLEDIGYTRSMIRHHFGNITKLHDQVISSGLITEVSTPNQLFNKNQKIPSDKKRFIVTTAVADSVAHYGFIESLRKYAEVNDAQIVVLPCESKVNSFQNDSAVFDPIFFSEDILIVNQDISLNDNIILRSIQISANQIKPITGMSRFGSREGSYIFASPKQFLEYVPSSVRGKNYAIMTPGACTKPNYMKDVRYVSKRLAYIADQDHTLGAIIVEIEDESLFHFRQIQADENGNFIDLGKKYSADSVEEGIETTLILGDIHGVNVDIDVISAFTRDFNHLVVKNVVCHDIFDGISISHHIITPGKKSKRFKESSVNDLLYEEALETFRIAQYLWKSFDPDDLLIVKSNHDEVIDRWIDESRFIYEPQNYRAGLELAIAKYDGGKDLLEKAMEMAAESLLEKSESEKAKYLIEKFTFLQRDDSVKISGVEIAAHGDLGQNGSRASLAQLEKIYGKCVIGHSHSAAIHRGVFRVGTFSKLDMGYNVGPTSWTHTGALLYEDGSCQLVNYVNDKFYL